MGLNTCPPAVGGWIGPYPREGEPWSAGRYASHQIGGDPMYTLHVREGQGRDRRVSGLVTVEHASFQASWGAIPKAARTPWLREYSHDLHGSELHPTGARRRPLRRQIGPVRKERGLGVDVRLLEPLASTIGWRGASLREAWPWIRRARSAAE